MKYYNFIIIFLLTMSHIGQTSNLNGDTFLFLELAMDNDPYRESIAYDSEEIFSHVKEQLKKQNNIKITSPDTMDLKNKLKDLISEDTKFSHVFITAHGCKGKIVVGKEMIEFSDATNWTTKNPFINIKGKLCHGAQIIFGSCNILEGSAHEVSSCLTGIRNMFDLKYGLIYCNKEAGSFIAADHTLPEIHYHVRKIKNFIGLKDIISDRLFANMSYLLCRVLYLTYYQTLPLPIASVEDVVAILLDFMVAHDLMCMSFEKSDRGYCAVISKSKISKLYDSDYHAAMSKFCLPTPQQ